MQIFLGNWIREGYTAALGGLQRIEKDESIHIAPRRSTDAIIFVEKDTNTPIIKPFNEVIYEKADGLFVSRKKAKDFYQDKAVAHIVEKVRFSGKQVLAADLKDKVDEVAYAARQSKPVRIKVTLAVGSIVLPISQSPLKATLIAGRKATKAISDDCLTLWIQETTEETFAKRVAIRFAEMYAFGKTALVTTSKKLFKKFRPRLEQN